MNRIVKSLIFLITISGLAQEQLSLQECYSLVNKNFPLAQQTALLEEQNTLDLDVIETKRLPELELSAQATYQSAVIEVPLQTIEPLNKDQYRATVSVNQLIYGGGIIDASLRAKSLALETSKKQVEVNLYQLKKKVNQLYFSVLLTQENILLLEATKSQLEAILKEIQSGIKYGSLMPTSDKIIEAELLKVQQNIVEFDETKISLLQTLSSLIGKKIGKETILLNDEIFISQTNEFNRPELALYQLKKQEIDASEALIAKKNSPRLFGFANGGYGNPGLNLLDNSFQAFYTVGLKVNWTFFDWNASKKERQSLAINKDIIDTESEVFQLNSNIELDQQQSDINKIETFITSDLQIIALRKEVLKAANSQLKNGVITSSAYIIELTNLYKDENSLIRHKIQLALAKANYKIIQGQ